jgi:hypothetical protein
LFAKARLFVKGMGGNLVTQGERTDLPYSNRYRKIERDAASAVRKELRALRTDVERPTKRAN